MVSMNQLDIRTLKTVMYAFSLSWLPLVYSATDGGDVHGTQSPHTNTTTPMNSHTNTTTPMNSHVYLVLLAAH